MVLRGDLVFAQGSLNGFGPPGAQLGTHVIFDVHTVFLKVYSTPDPLQVTRT